MPAKSETKPKEIEVDIKPAAGVEDRSVVQAQQALQALAEVNRGFQRLQSDVAQLIERTRPSTAAVPAPHYGLPPVRLGLRTTRDVKRLGAREGLPPCDVVDDGKHFILQMDLPGVRKEGLDITCYEEAVTVSAQCDPDLGDGALVLHERGPVNYQRTIPLPARVQTEGCHAVLKDGTLTLRLPKRVPTGGPRHVDVAFG